MTFEQWWRQYNKDNFQDMFVMDIEDHAQAAFNAGRQAAAGEYEKQIDGFCKGGCSDCSNYVPVEQETVEIVRYMTECCSCVYRTMTSSGLCSLHGTPLIKLTGTYTRPKPKVKEGE